jgi:hypothetical protein
MTAWRLGLGALLGALLVVLLATPASAAMWMRITLDPDVPTAGQATRVSVLTFTLSQNRCWDDSAASPIPVSTWFGSGRTPGSLALELVARGPTPQDLHVPLAQRRDNGAYWDGTITFPDVGEWTLLVRSVGSPLNWATADTSGNRCAGLVRTVRVTDHAEQLTGSANRKGQSPRENGTHTWDWILIVAASVTATLAAVVVRRSRRKVGGGVR